MIPTENISLAPFTTFSIGGAARWFVEAENEDDIVQAHAWAEDRRVPLFVLGGGSNLLVSDAGFDGLVLRVALRGITSAPAPDATGQTVFQAAAGEDWEHFVQRATEANCAGIECLAGIPGTVGGTPVQNVGAYGQEVASAIERVRAFDTQERTFVEFSNADCGFAYRHSRFNSVDRGRYIITRVDYRFTPGGAPTLRYGDLQRTLAARQTEGRELTLAEVAAVVREVRQSKGMLLVEGDPDCRSAGSFFKNLFKVPAAWLIEQAGFPKGYALGAAGISTRHTLALTNRGGATAAEVLALASQIVAAVETRFDLRLTMEPVMVGF